jgi:hypothetical protein
MKCRCRAKLGICDINDAACPASTHRLLHDEMAAVQDLYEFARLDKKEGMRMEDEASKYD